MDNLLKFIEKVEKSEPAKTEDIVKIAAFINHKLPESYEKLLTITNGFEGEVENGNYIVVWKAEEVIQLNNASEAKTNVPDMLLIGGDGGNEAIGIDFRENSKTFGNYFRVPLIPMQWKEAKHLGAKIEDIKIT